MNVSVKLVSRLPLSRTFTLSLTPKNVSSWTGDVSEVCLDLGPQDKKDCSLFFFSVVRGAGTRKPFASVVHCRRFSPF